MVSTPAKPKRKRAPGGGRPKKYTPSFLENEAKVFLAWAKNKYRSKTLFLLEEFSVERDYPSDYFDDWARENTIFSLTLKKVKEMQKVVISHLMTAAEKPTGFIFLSKNVCGYRDTHDISGNVTFTPISFGDTYDK